MTLFQQIIVISCMLIGSSISREFQFFNNCSYTLWIGNAGNFGQPSLENGGFILDAYERFSTHSDDFWVGRFWARTGCNETTEYCEVGDCGSQLQCNGTLGTPPITTANIILRGERGLDFYDISLVDGFNVPISMEPLAGRTDGGATCAKTGCGENINENCPEELRVVVNATTVGCKSACTAFNTDQYCCRGAHDKPWTCRNDRFPVDYPKIFKDLCPDALSYIFDDFKKQSCFRAPAYLLTFC